jgi:hypothetical protein
MPSSCSAYPHAVLHGAQLLSTAACSAALYSAAQHIRMQMGYNLLYGLYKASYDADCSLFLGVLRGDVKEDVYIQTAQLQVMLIAVSRSY